MMMNKTHFKGGSVDMKDDGSDRIEKIRERQNYSSMDRHDGGSFQRLPEIVKTEPRDIEELRETTVSLL